MQTTIELSDGGGRRRVVLDGPVEVGREGEGLVLDDAEVSRRHVRLEPTEAGLVVTDLGSTNGTLVNGARITAPCSIAPGDVVTVGTSTVTVVPERPAVPPPPPPPGTNGSAVGSLLAMPAGAITLRYAPGTAGESAAPAIAAAAPDVLGRLAPLAPPDLGPLQVFLVDPLPDPQAPDRFMTEGTVVDGARGEIWMVVTAEAPPEPLDRPVALLLAERRGIDPGVAVLYAGYAIDRAGAPDPSAHLRELDLPPLAEADGELQVAMSLSFVRHLRHEHGPEALDRFLAGAVTGHADRVSTELFGQGIVALEEEWREKLAAGGEPVNPAQFVRVTARYLRPHRWRQLEILVYMLLGLVFTVVFPFAFQRLIDGPLVPDEQGRLGDFSDVTLTLAVLGAAFVVSLLADLRRSYVSAYVSNSVVRQIRQEIFDRLQALEMGWFSRHQQGDVFGRLFTDVNVLEQGLSEAVRDGVFQALSLVVTAAVLVTLNWQLAIIVLVGAPLVAVVYRFMARGAQQRSAAVQEQLSDVMGVAAENYAAQPVVKAFGLERRESGRFSQASARLLRSEVRLELFGGIFGLSVNMIVTVLRIVVLATGAWLILNGDLTTGAFVAFISLMGQVLSPVTVLTGVGQQIQQSGGALARINEVLESVPAIADPPSPVPLGRLQHEIRLQDVSFSYTPERQVLDGVDVRIPAGAKVAFVGPSGAGKSSVMQLLMRFYDPDRGSVTYDGIDLRSVSPAALRGQLGVVFQESVLFDASVRENLALAKPDATNEEIEAAARAAELHEFVEQLPRGYDTPVGERGGKLSGGQRQRLAIARALLRDPAVLLLDEATSALDPRTERAISATLDRVGQGRTTIAVTHRLGSVTDYDLIVVIDRGGVAEQGTHEQLLALGGVYATLWAEQTGGPAPEPASVDPVDALARLPLFADLEPTAVAAIATRLDAADLAAGAVLDEERGQLAVLERGGGRVTVPGLDGRRISTAELGPGDAFGVGAALGELTGATLELTAASRVHFLTPDALAVVAREHPVVGALLSGQAAGPVPQGGHRLTRATVALPAVELPPTPANRPAIEDEVERLTGAFPVARA